MMMLLSPASATIPPVAVDVLHVRGFRDDKSWNRVSHATIDDLPVLQSVGKNPSKPELRVKLHPGLGDSAQLLGGLELLGEADAACALQLGNGFLLGWFKLMSIQRDWLKTLADGTIVEADLTVALEQCRPPVVDIGPLLGVVGFAAPERLEPEQIDTSGDPTEVPLSQVVRL